MIMNSMLNDRGGSRDKNQSSILKENLQGVFKGCVYPSKDRLRLTRDVGTVTSTTDGFVQLLRIFHMLKNRQGPGTAGSWKARITQNMDTFLKASQSESTPQQASASPLSCEVEIGDSAAFCSLMLVSNQCHTRSAGCDVWCRLSKYACQACMGSVDAL